MASSLLPAAVALCAALLLVLARQLLIPEPKPAPSPPAADLEKASMISIESDICLKADVIDDVWPPVERETDTPTPTIAALPDVPLVWGMDYSPADRPLGAYSHIASALGVDEPEPAVRCEASPTDTRPMVGLFDLLFLALTHPSAPAASFQALSATGTRSARASSRPGPPSPRHAPAPGHTT